MVYGGGLTPRRAGGIGSVLYNIIKHTSKQIEYLLLTTYDESESLEIRELYPPTVRIEYVRPHANVFDGFVYYSVKNFDDFDILHFHCPPVGRELAFALKNYFRGKKLIYSHHISYEATLNNKLKLAYYFSSLNLFGRIWKKVVAPSRFVAKNDLARFRSLQGKICLKEDYRDHKGNEEKPC